MKIDPNETSIRIDVIEEAINEIFPGIAILVRDVNLDPRIFALYQKGMIIREKAFVDASYRVQGMVTSHRYVILSNHMKDLSSFEMGTNWGLCVAQHDSHFKVLGTCCHDGKTAIFLLHLPDDERWEVFSNVHINLEDDLLERAIESFKKKCLLSPVPELTTSEWLKRCEFPVGVDYKGVLWPLE